MKISGIVVRKFESSNGQCHALELDKPVDLNHQPTEEVAIGKNHAGMHRAEPLAKEIVESISK